LTEERLKIAVFIDFDNIAIGVKQSLSRNFDIGNVLEAIKERGEVVTKVAYGDWKRAEEFSRTMTQHAVQMVQRNPTPGGDKNGADINLALDALEMAFTRDHINAFVIVGGDSDFIALVEKLKQYDKKVFVVGGRAFTSAILQKNCHEFIAYENLVGIQSGSRRSTGRVQSSSPAQLKTALPQIRRALKVLIDREVSPQLGLLKSTLLQLDPTFSERDYGTTTFRDFIQKLADAGFLKLKQVDRSLLVELKEPDGTRPLPPEEAPPPPTADAEEAPTAVRDAGPAPAQLTEAVRAVQEAFQSSANRPHWPMYLRSFKQFLRSANPPLDERRLGISNLYDLVRQAQRDGVLRVERNRQGILRIFPGDRLAQSAQEETPDQTSSQPQPIQEQMEIPLEELPTEASERESEITAPEVTAESAEGKSLQAAAESDAPAPKRKRRSAAASTKRVKRAKTPSTRSRKKSAEPKHEAQTSPQK
jgi:uncharacterized LabA/DUF88 family protein